MAFDGEAPETDDEIEEENYGKSEQQEKITIKEQIPVDKKLEKHWTLAATELINSCYKRSANQEKTMQKVTESAADCFTSMQNVAAKLNVIHTNVTRLEDSVADLLEASQLIPKNLSNFELNIPEFI